MIYTEIFAGKAVRRYIFKSFFSSDFLSSGQKSPIAPSSKINAEIFAGKAVKRQVLKFNFHFLRLSGFPPNLNPCVPAKIAQIPKWHNHCQFNGNQIKFILWERS